MDGSGGAGAVVDIPTLDQVGLGVLAFLLAAVGSVALRRRRRPLRPWAER